uniref:ANK_REP_REGION domain-containing protein n=1 Tax=Macrostomum lignano TaxID=282301 RepID=A0A1I8F745_9PLAT
DQGFKCSWPFIEHPNWKVSKDLSSVKFDTTIKNNLLTQANLLSFAFFSSMGLAIVLVHLAGRYSTRRKYYEPLASEVKAYSAEMGSTVQKTALDRAVFDCQEVPDFAVSIVLAMLDPLSLSYSFDVALHDYGRAVLPTIVTLLLTRSVYYTIAYHVFTYCSRENFNCLSDFIHRRFNSIGLANVSATLMLAYEICQLVLMYNQTAREMSSMIGSSFQFWLVCLSCITFCMAVCGTGSLVKICLLIYGLSIIVYLWMCLQIRFLFAMSTPDTLLYESNIICSLLAAPLLHTASRLDQTEYTVYQSLIRRFRRKRVFVRAFLLNVSYNMCHKTLLRSLFALRAKEGCDQVAAGITCHYGMLSKAMTSHASLKALYLSLIFYRACWLGGVKVVATAHAATRSRMMRSFVELCLIGQRWAHMTRWRRQNGLILFRGCRLIDLQIYVYNTFIVALTWCTLLFCLDNLPLDPSVLKVQFANYLILDLRFMIFLNATLLGLTFRRLSRSVLYWILALSCCCTPTRSCDTLRYKLMTPIYKSHAAWLRRNCSKKIRLRPVINVGQRIVDHEVLHLADSDAFYRPSQLAVLKSPYYCIGDLASVNFARRISSGLVNWVAHLLSAARASLQSVFAADAPWRNAFGHISSHKQR